LANGVFRDNLTKGYVIPKSRSAAEYPVNWSLRSDFTHRNAPDPGYNNPFHIARHRQAPKQTSTTNTASAEKTTEQDWTRTEKTNPMENTQEIYRATEAIPKVR
jgi:hypothetical protein